MKRIYLDSNVFRKLKRDISEDSLYSKLLKSKDRLLFIYSHAHLLDLQQDKTNYKFDDLEFMENLVEDNYLSIPHKRQHADLQLVTPRVAFDSIGTGYDLDDNLLNLESLFDFDGIDMTPELEAAKEKLARALNTPLKLDIKSNIEKHQQGNTQAWEKLLPEIKDEYTMKEWFQVFSKMYSNLVTTDAYKELRKNSMDSLQLTTKFDIDIEDFSFDEDLKNTPINKSFLELVDQSVSYNESAQTQYEYMYFITAFNLLNILGIDKEKNKKAVFVNTINDAQHAFYGAHSDIVISDDEGFLLKSKVLYKLLGIETVTKNLDEFQNEYLAILGVTDISLNSYLEFLTYELSNSLIIDSQFDINLDTDVVSYKTNNFHFGYFNRFDYFDLKEKGQQYVFYKEIANYSRFHLYKEYEAITNKIYSLFKIDDNGRKEFSEVDVAEIKERKWKGRQWSLNKIHFILRKNYSNEEINFAIRIVQNTTDNML